MSQERKVYRVLPDGESWKLKGDHNERASGVFATQSEAAARGREMAIHEGHSQLVVHGRDGQIQNERTYGDDPFPPAG